MGEILLEYNDLTSTSATFSARGERLGSTSVSAPVTGVEGASTVAIDTLVARAQDLGAQLTALAGVVTEVRDEVETVDRSQVPQYSGLSPYFPSSPGGGYGLGPGLEGYQGHVTQTPGAPDVVELPENLTPGHDASSHGSGGAGSGPGQKDRP
ncbi:hypothetical protein QWY28_10825 [Nocardioides sp. SOB77]|uniref:Excreted virulence factor EspC, type VII ESX diderm n=1 Tax=Nocardioides oceani TaxID=3058369 RepID=A0ABT8FFI5_9ACTN|nr:hypothetical protein [Nocardioides oceani]MDN4173438.1 hypothetical protein [Nocardioides oceani]